MKKPAPKLKLTKDTLKSLPVRTGVQTGVLPSVVHCVSVSCVVCSITW